MQEVFEKIIEKLEEYRDENLVEHDFEMANHCKQDCNGNDVSDCTLCVWDKAIEIVKQEAEQYNNGWIPVSEKLPEESLNSVIGWDEYRERCCVVQYIGGRFVLGDDTEPVKITHWMYLPYHQKGE